METIYKCCKCLGTEEDTNFNMAVEIEEEIGELWCDLCYEIHQENYDPKGDLHDKFGDPNND